MTAILDSVVKEGFTDEVTSSLKSKKEKEAGKLRGRNTVGVSKEEPERLVWVKQSDSAHSGREVREVSRAKCLRNPHPRKSTHP